MNKTGGECGQNGGSQKQNAFHPPMPWSRTKCSGGDAGEWLADVKCAGEIARYISMVQPMLRNIDQELLENQQHQDNLSQECSKQLTASRINEISD